jgi:hypothetical protein
MACIQYPRKERGGVSLPSYEKPTIYKEPPKAIFTKKKERIEEGDVTYNIRNDSSRYDDAITNYQKGQNMMVTVDYQNRAPQTTTMNFGSSSNPYKVNQAFRPPEFKLIDLQPLSRQQRPYVSGQTNIGSQITRNDSSDIRMDQRQIDFSIGANTTMHTANTNASHEMGVYYDNHDRTDMVHTDMSTYDITSALKGIESVELQKLFSYEQTPYGIVLTPLSIQVDTSVSGPSNVEPHRHMDTDSHLQNQLVYEQNTNISGHKDVESQRHLSNLVSYLQEQLSVGQGTNIMGMPQYDAQRHLADQDAYIRSDGTLVQFGTNLNSDYYHDADYTLDTNGYIQEPLRVAKGTNVSGQINLVNGTHISSDILSYLQNQLHYGIGSNLRGQVTVESQRELSDVLSYLKDELVVSKGANQSGGVIHVDSQRHISDLISFLQDKIQVGAGTNQNGGMKTTISYEHQEQMKDILLKNMTSAVHIVIQKAGVADEYQVKGNIQDKIGIVVNSTKGGALQLMGDNGQPIRLKDYTWKFVKSAMGADKFIIQLSADNELKLERKGELYAVYSNPSQHIAQMDHDDVHLKRDAMNITVITNVELQGNMERPDESQFQRIEKQTHYTNHMVQSNTPSLERAESTLESIRGIQSGKKQNIKQTMLLQSEGRFD